MPKRNSQIFPTFMSKIYILIILTKFPLCIRIISQSTYPSKILTDQEHSMWLELQSSSSACPPAARPMGIGLIREHSAEMNQRDKHKTQQRILRQGECPTPFTKITMKDETCVSFCTTNRACECRQTYWAYNRWDRSESHVCSKLSQKVPKHKIYEHRPKRYGDNIIPFNLTTCSDSFLKNDSLSASEENLFLLWNPKFHCCVHNRPPLVLSPPPILGQMNPVQTFPPYFSKTRHNSILPSTPRSSNWSLPFRFWSQNFVYISHPVILQDRDFWGNNEYPQSE
jgi:hypothetical protein